MVNNKSNSNKSNEAKIFLLDRFVCNYIKKEWISDTKSNLSQSQELGIHPHVLTKIKNDDGYRIPLSTLAIICFYKKIELSDFFKLIEKQYGSKINDDFVLKTNTKKDA
jgi:DNA-binding Xre family transcriptional regulator